MDIIHDMEMEEAMDMGFSKDLATPLPSSSRSAAAGTVVVDEAHPFDLDAYISGYSG
ncbi:hypothetical protein EWM64_g8249 [Hericium alpestre]|uniref:Uncharacterized protein n=1 Tax=Hericium alpestre TaxID=135208 RepID=A0A4Y9ZLN3_9AGAM|nr:hypothetical protein EWM64_g8249 [Hericium alpestre]